MLEHGGRLRAAAQRYGIALEDWLDLSTGINPNVWPVPALPAETWLRLPESDDGLEAAARDYYNTSSLLPVAGTQAAIQVLSRLRASCRVSVIEPGYAEHAHAWQEAGHTVTRTPARRLNDAVTQSDVLVIINPNNPTGECFGIERLLGWHAQLAARGGWLIVDEAFMDATPEQSLARFTPRNGLIVLRSLGKFFGLAGARVGFVLADREQLESMQSLLGPWTIAGPARWVAMQALADRAWQMTMCVQLAEHSIRLARLLNRHGLAPTGGCALFQWTCAQAAAPLHEQLARSGILTRRFDQPASLRFGLPRTEQDWQRLERALREVRAA